MVLLGLALMAGGVLFCSDALASRVLGRMDAEWRDEVQRASPFNFPADWAVEDWWHIMGAFGIALAACNGPLQDPKSRRLIACVARVGRGRRGHSRCCLSALLCPADSGAGLPLALAVAIPANSFGISARLQLVAARRPGDASRCRGARRLPGKHRGRSASVSRPVAHPGSIRFLLDSAATKLETAPRPDTLRPRHWLAHRV